MMQLAQTVIDRHGERLDPEARPVLYRKLEEVGRRRMTDDLGNRRFVRSLIEKAGQARDVRVITSTTNTAEQDLLTIRAGDLEQGYAELTRRLHGDEDSPTVEGALAELDLLVGLEPVKQQVRAIAAQLQAAQLRERLGLSSQPPSRYFIFTGPSGTGKTTVARILGRIFAALGLLRHPGVVRVQRTDLVGEQPGMTAIRTNRLIDSAMGGVLFIEEAHLLNSAGYTHSDALGTEALQVLIRRTDNDRDRRVIVLAGQLADMDEFLRSNPWVASRFRTRMEFPSYSANDLLHIAKLLAERTEDAFDVTAVRVLSEIFRRVAEAGTIDELGNSRFAQSLVERACAYRDLRVVPLNDVATAEDLTTMTAGDVVAAYRELTGGQTVDIPVESDGPAESSMATDPGGADSTVTPTAFDDVGAVDGPTAADGITGLNDPESLSTDMRMA